MVMGGRGEQLHGSHRLRRGLAILVAFGLDLGSGHLIVSAFVCGQVRAAGVAMRSV
jgi:hypothetical protein